MLDTNEMKVGPEGVANFFWPLAQGELQAFRDTLLRGFASVARSRQDAADDERDLFGAFCQALARECLALFVVHTLLRRIRAAGHEPVYPASGLYASLNDGGVPAESESAMVRTFIKGPAQSAIWRRAIAKRVRDAAFNGLGWRALRASRAKHDIMACYPTPVLVEHARSVPDAVKYTLLEEWFGTLSEDEIARAQPALSADLRTEVLGVVKDAFDAGGEALPLHLRAYIDRLTAEGGRLAKIHLDKVIAQPDRVPRRLWTGSGAYVWTRLLRHAVRRLGGEVVGHEHGTGEGLISYFNSKAFMDLESADRFVTFNSNQCRWLKETIDSKYVIPTVMPTIDVPRYRTSDVKYAGGAVRKRARKGPDRGRRPAIMYVASIYVGDQPRIGHHNADLVITDWQARLIAKLRSWGYDVLFKAHPEGTRRPPEAFARDLGATFIEGRFEDVWTQADAAIFDWKSTSALSGAMSTDLPLVMVDFGFEQFVPEAKVLIERRCAIVYGGADADNRLQVDWAEVQRALKDPRPASDRGFLEAAMRFA